MPPFSVDFASDTIITLIQRWADRTPGAPAFLEEGIGELSYDALATAIDTVGSGCRRCGLLRGGRIALVHGGRAEMAVAVLGIMNHSAVIPLNPGLTKNEFEIYLRDLRVTGLIVQENLDTYAISAARALSLPVLNIAGADGDFALTADGAEGSKAPLPPEGINPPAPEDTAVFLMTSGTTAEGKIIPLRHRHLLARALNAERHLAMTAADRCLLSQPLHYANGINQLISSLSSGGSLIFVPAFSVDGFFHHLAAHGITCLTAGVTFLTRLHEEMQAYRAPDPSGRLRFIRSTSGWLDPAIADGLESFFDTPVVESYSSTETNNITCNPLPPARRKRGTVGVPAGAEVRIRSLDGRFLPEGGRGEVVVRGPQVFEGYENAPELNAEAFSEGWYRTGDEGEFDGEGYLTLTGRMKEMINRGGEKVNPSEVDGAILSHPAVKDAATFPIPHPTLGEEVACAVVIAPGASVTRPELTRFLLDRLTGFKVPRRFVFTTEIPRGETSKIRRGRLAEFFGLDQPALGQALRADGDGNDEARAPSPLEARLASIWADLLGLDRIGLDDNFFLLGGDSLQAVELFVRIERTLGRRLPVACLFEAGTVAEMAALMEGQDSPGCIVAIQPETPGENTKPPFFCVHGNGGEVIGFHNLARHLGKDQPFYGIQSVGWDAAKPPFTSSEAMAAHYVEEIRKVQPRGPYFLGGYSFGGRIAIYMARQLRSAGEDLALLALIDPISYAGQRYVTLDQWMARREADAQGIGRLAGTGRYLRFRGSKMFGAIYDHLRRAVLFSIIGVYRRLGRPLPRSLRRPDRVNRLLRLEQSHIPTYQGDAVHFKARFSKRSTYHPDTRATWDRVIQGKLTEYQIDGLHDQIIQEPYAEALAGALAVELEKARSAGG